MAKSDFYKNMKALEYDGELIVGEKVFRIAGEMSDGTKCWYKVDPETDDVDLCGGWYSMHNISGRKVAILEGIS